MRTTITVFVLSTVLSLGTRAFGDELNAPPPTAPPPAASNAPPTATISSGTSQSLKGLSLWGVLPWGGIGAGGRFMLPLAIKPLLVNTSIRDSFALELGGDLLTWSRVAGSGSRYTWTEILPVAGVMWNLWFSDNFALYPKIEVGYHLGWVTGWNEPGSSPSSAGPFIAVDVGLLYKLNNGLTFRVEAGNANLKVGAGWLF